jgi:hypothetical protein
MNYEEKVRLIDNQQNKEVVANAIADSILTKYDLKDYSPKLTDWLRCNIMQSSLADMLTNNQDMYVINLAKKCSADMAYIHNECNLSIDEIIERVRPIAVFCSTIAEEYGFNTVETAKEMQETISNFDYGDTLILDDKMFVYNDNVEEERVLHPFRVHIRVGYHPNYNQKELKKRIAGRLYYHRDPNDLCVTFLSEDIDNNGDFHFCLRISDVLDKDEFEQAIRFRLGKTSGKPWYRCHIEDIA